MTLAVTLDLDLDFDLDFDFGLSFELCHFKWKLLYASLDESSFKCPVISKVLRDRTGPSRSRRGAVILQL